MAIALAVVMVLAMLVPAAMAAPQADGITILYPTTLAKAYVNPDEPLDDEANWAKGIDAQGDESFFVKFQLAMDGLPVEGIIVKYEVLGGNGLDPLEVTEEFEPTKTDAQGDQVPQLFNGAQLQSMWLTPGGDDTGLFNLKVCWWYESQWDGEGEPDEPGNCTTQVDAVLLDEDAPGVELLMPVPSDDPHEFYVVTGKAFELTGQAWDPAEGEDNMDERYGGIKETWFDFCSNVEAEHGECPENFERNNEHGWVRIGAGVPSGFAGDVYKYTWDTTQIELDQHAAIRFCAEDWVELVTCEKASVVVENHFTFGDAGDPELQAGWNLISTPILLYDNDMDSVMAQLGTKVREVWTVVNNGAAAPKYAWQKWTPGDNMKFEDGKGYFVKLETDSDFTLTGSYGAAASWPVEYPVAEGWNLVGYTYWGRPAISSEYHLYQPELVLDYLGQDIAQKFESMWWFDAETNTWDQVYPLLGGPKAWMMKGFGYFLSVAEGGSINP
jgi:hypothetical protein